MTAKGQRCRLHPEASTRSEANDLTARRGRQAAPGLGARRVSELHPTLVSTCPLHLGTVPSAYRAISDVQSRKEPRPRGSWPTGKFRGAGGTSRIHQRVCWGGQCPAMGGLPRSRSAELCVRACVRAHRCLFILHTWHRGGDLGHSPGLSWEGSVRGRLPGSQAVTAQVAWGSRRAQASQAPAPAMGRVWGQEAPHRTARLC